MAGNGCINASKDCTILALLRSRRYLRRFHGGVAGVSAVVLALRERFLYRRLDHGAR
jgi:hypothetical protein